MEDKTALAVDLGGTRIKMGIVKGPNIIAYREMDAESGQGLRQRLPVLASVMNDLLRETETATSEIAGIGLAIPGIVDNVRQQILTINDKYNDAPDVDLVAWARDTWNLPLFLENDTRAALLGEWKYGNGRGFDNIVLMNLGTGIGTSAVVEGKILRGKHFQAGILGGHFVVHVGGEQCNCGNYGCAEAEASTWNLKKIISQYPQYAADPIFEEKPDFKAIFEQAAKNNPLALAVRDTSLKVWAACALNLVLAYDPEIVIMGGGIMGSSDVILPYIDEKVNQNGWATWGKVIVKKSSLIHSAALLGAGSLVSPI